MKIEAENCYPLWHTFNISAFFLQTDSSDLQNHRMLRAGMDFKDRLVPTPHAVGHLPLHQVAQGLIQPGFEHCQRLEGIHYVPGQSVPVPHHPQSK